MIEFVTARGVEALEQVLLVWRDRRLIVTCGAIRGTVEPCAFFALLVLPVPLASSDPVSSSWPPQGVCPM